MLANVCFLIIEKVNEQSFQWKKSLRDATLFMVMGENWLNQFLISTNFCVLQIVFLMEEGANYSCHRLLEYSYMLKNWLVFFLSVTSIKRDCSKTIVGNLLHKIWQITNEVKKCLIHYWKIYEHEDSASDKNQSHCHSMSVTPWHSMTKFLL